MKIRDFFTKSSKKVSTLFFFVLFAAMMLLDAGDLKEELKVKREAVISEKSYEVALKLNQAKNKIETEEDLEKFLKNGEHFKVKESKVSIMVKTENGKKYHISYEMPLQPFIEEVENEVYGRFFLKIIIKIVLFLFGFICASFFFEIYGSAEFLAISRDIEGVLSLEEGKEYEPFFIEFQQMKGKYLKIKEEKERKEKELIDISLTDRLTGLPNKTHFQRVFETRKRPFYVICFNLKHFKEINDHLSFEIGDEILNLIAERLFRLHEKIFVAKSIADEFLILVKEDRYYEEMVSHIENVITRNLLVGEKLHHFEVYSGSLYVDRDYSFNEAMRLIEIAKEVGRLKGGNALFEEKMEVVAKEKYILRKELEADLEGKENFSVHYQTIVGPGKRHYEALARHSKYPVGTFIQALEESRNITALTVFVFKEACKFIKRKQNKVSVSVNVSSIDLDKDEFAEIIDTIREKYEVETENILLELTESVAFSKRGRKEMSKLRKMGYQFLLDDFGTGYNNISRLKEEPFHFIKIDKSLIDHIEEEGAREALANILGLIRSFHLEVIVEGVERQSQLDILEEMSVQYFQGFLFAKPMPEAKL